MGSSLHVALLRFSLPWDSSRLTASAGLWRTILSALNAPVSRVRSPAERRAVAAQPMGYAELKHHSRQDCPDQGRDSYVPPPGDPAPCYLNEKTCTSFYNSTGMGRSINITYDWKHFMYEDYDRWLYSRQAPRHSARRDSSWPHACEQGWPLRGWRHTSARRWNASAGSAMQCTHLGRQQTPCIVCGLLSSLDCRWSQEKSGPTYLFVSPGLHDCYHQPDQYGTTHVA